MISTNSIDIKEDSIEQLDYELLTILLQDKSSGKNIIWATDDYSQNGYGFRRDDEIQIYAIVGNNGDIIRPRTAKTKQEQQNRIKYICAKQGGTAGNFIPVPATLFVAGQVFCFCPANKKFYERRQKYV